MSSARLLGLLLAVAVVMGLSGGVALAVNPYPDNGVFVEHGYVCVAKTEAQIQEVVTWCQQRQIKVQFLNITGFNADGTMDPANYSELAHYIAVTRQADPEQMLIAYCSGSLSGHVNNPATHQNIANVCKMFFDDFAVDGVNLDFEPFQADNQNYINLFSTIRQTVGAGRHLSLDTTGNLTWSPSFLNQVSTYFDWLMPMFYDTGLGTVAAYQNWVIAGMHHHSDNMAANCQLYPIIPNHKKSRWHNPTLENFCTATDAIMQSIAEGCEMASLGVWWRYDWAADDDQMWTDCWLSRFDQPPVANFSGNPTSGAVPLTVLFTDLSTNGPTSWSWNFGDSGTSTQQNPSHPYTSAGTYTVTLTATNAYGSDIETKTNYITVTAGGQAPVANFSGSPTSGTAPLTVSFTDLSTNGPTSWSWNFGDSGTSTQQNPSHQYTSAGTYTVTLTATNAYGSDVETKTNYITVTPSSGEYTCNSLTIAVGTLVSGDHTSVHASDNTYLVNEAVKDGGNKNSIIHYSFLTGLGSLSSLTITSESHPTVPPRRQRVYCWNFSSNSWSAVLSDSDLTSGGDTTTVVNVSNPAAYLSPTGEIIVRMRTGDRGADVWTHYVDYLKINAAP